MKKSCLLVLLIMTTFVIITLTSCCGPPLYGPNCSSYYAHPSDYSVWYGPNFVQPVAWNPGYWSSYPESGYRSVGYVPVTYGRPYNMVAVLHDGAP